MRIIKFFHFISAETETNCNDDLLKCNSENKFSTSASQATPSASKNDEYIYQIWIREEDLNRFSQNGNIKFNQNKFFYRHN